MLMGKGPELRRGLDHCPRAPLPRSDAAESMLVMPLVESVLGNASHEEKCQSRRVERLPAEASLRDLPVGAMAGETRRIQPENSDHLHVSALRARRPRKPRKLLSGLKCAWPATFD